MLYLLRSFGPVKSGKLNYIYKVGYTRNIKKRFEMYKSHNPYIQLISTREGEEFEEKLLHLFLHSYGLGVYKDEWYSDENREIINLFHCSLDDIKRRLWRNRESAFNYSEFREEYLHVFGSPLNIYYQLRERFKSETKIIKPIDNFVSKLCHDFSFGEITAEVYDYIKTIYSFKATADKYKYLCSLPEQTVLSILPHLPSNFQNYYTVLGPDRMRALWYDVTKMKKEYDGVIGNQGICIRDYIIPAFKIGEIYSKAKVKEKLREIYDSVGYSKTPRAVDLGDYFIIKNTMITNKETGKRDACYYIEKVKDGGSAD